MKLFFLLLSFGVCFLLPVGLVSCATHTIEIGKPTPVPSPAPDPSVEISKILAASPQCVKYSWKNRGVAPMVYFQAIAEQYHVAICEKNPEVTLGTSSKDALAHYGLPPSLRNTYTLLIGLGLRESSGKFCTGRDTSATNVSASTAEAGVFQFSYDSVAGKAHRQAIFDKYRKSCPRPVPCSSQNWGTGPGVEFQKLAKTCPAFSVEYAAMLIRELRAHFGPLNRKEVEFREECGAMLDKVAKVSCN